MADYAVHLPIIVAYNLQLVTFAVVKIDLIEHFINFKNLSNYDLLNLVFIVLQLMIY